MGDARAPCRPCDARDRRVRLSPCALPAYAVRGTGGAAINLGVSRAAGSQPTELVPPIARDSSSRVFVPLAF
jgi:hypothetical protein